MAHFRVALVELAVEAADVQVVHAGQAAELLVGREANSQQVVARQSSRHGPVSVDGQLAMCAQMGQGGEADAVDRDHHAGAAGIAHEIVAAAELIDVAGDVK